MKPAMAEHPNVQKIRDAFVALGAGDLTGALKDFAPAGVIHFNRRGPLGGVHMGAENIKVALVADYILTDGTQQYHVQDIFADDRHGVVVLRQTASRPDAAMLDLEGVLLLAFDSEGQVTDIWDLPSDRDVQTRFFEGK
jgi:hypothetical protein